MTLPDGTHVSGVTDLKRHLREQRATVFANALAHHMLTYTLGRGPDFADSRELGHICERSGLAAAVQLVHLPHLPKGESYDADLRLKGVLRLADPLLGLAFGRIGDRAAEGLRAYLDGSCVEG